MKALIAPLNWGLGHATRCIPLIRKYLKEGHEVVIAADGAPAYLLNREFPEIRMLDSPSYPIRYSSSNSQVGAMLLNLPAIIKGIYNEHQWLNQLLEQEHFDCIISDNRFGLWNKTVRSVYISHQLMIRMPVWLRWLEPFAWLMHRSIIHCYDECLIPDLREKPNLSGILSHRYPIPRNARFIGPLSRFEGLTGIEAVETGTLLMLSGPEPQRSMFEKELLLKMGTFIKPIVMVRGLPDKSEVPAYNNMTIYNHLNDRELASYIKGARQLICRSGYSTIMDLEALGCLQKAHFIPTPGQTEQEYLAEYHT